MLSKIKTINSFFKPIGSSANGIEAIASRGSQSNVQVEAPNLEGGTHNDHVQNPNNESNVAATAKPIEAEVAEHPPVVATRFERDPGKSVQILELTDDQQDEARRFYILEGPYQPVLAEYPLSELAHRRRFQSNWFKQFTWLEYSSHTNRA
jgi:hypothetical protein